jgi:hypothetical protein
VPASMRPAFTSNALAPRPPDGGTPSRRWWPPVRRRAARAARGRSGLRALRHVENAVGLHRQDLVGARGGADADGTDAADLPDVPAHLWRGVDQRPDQLEVGTGLHRRDRVTANVAGRPLHDSKHVDELTVRTTVRRASSTDPTNRVR